jgi:hypothetical protein
MNRPIRFFLLIMSNMLLSQVAPPNLCAADALIDGDGPTQKDCSGKISSIIPPAGFEAQGDKALKAMRSKADSLKIGGVAVIAFFEGNEPQSWVSKMSAVGRYKDPANATDPGANLLAIAYAKASEMALTLRNSGDPGRPKLVGELCWQGGVVRPWKNGYVIAAFSGGKSEDDVEVSKAGVAAVAE